VQAIIQKRSHVLFWILLALAAGLYSPAIKGAPCTMDESDVVTLYVYDEQDASFLMNQTCHTADGQPLDSPIGQAECRCYDKNPSEVSSEVNDGQSPVAVQSKVLKPLPEGLRCQQALRICQDACNAHREPRGCPALRSAAVSPE